MDIELLPTQSNSCDILGHATRSAAQEPEYWPELEGHSLSTYIPKSSTHSSLTHHTKNGVTQYCMMWKLGDYHITTTIELKNFKRRLSLYSYYTMQVYKDKPQPTYTTTLIRWVVGRHPQHRSSVPPLTTTCVSWELSKAAVGTQCREITFTAMGCSLGLGIKPQPPTWVESALPIKPLVTGIYLKLR